MRLEECRRGLEVVITSAPPGHLLAGQRAMITAVRTPRDPLILRETRTPLAWPTGQVELRLDPSLVIRRWAGESVTVAPEDIALPGGEATLTVVVRLPGQAATTLAGLIDPEAGRYDLPGILADLAAHIAAGMTDSGSWEHRAVVDVYGEDFPGWTQR